MAKSLFIQITDQIRLEYTVEGEGKPLLLLKGTGSINNETYPYLINQLKETYKVYTFNYPGFCKSTNARWDDELMIHIIETFCDKLKIKHPVIIGYSIGAYFAIKYTIKYPADVAKLILISPITSQFRQSFTHACYSVTTELIEEKNKLVKARVKRFSLPIESLSPKKIYRLVQLYLFIKNIDLSEELKEIDCPTYIFIGEKDRILNVETEIKDAKLVHNAMLKVYDDDGHYIIHNKADDICKIALG